MMMAFGRKQTTSLMSVGVVVKSACAVSILFAVIALSGCKKESKVSPAAPVIESVYTNRSHDAAYMGSLRQSYSNQMSQATLLRQAAGDLKAYEEKVKASLPAGATAEALKQALEKDEAWLKLKAKVDAAHAADRHAWEAARANVRVRLEQEARDNQAVVEGRAKAIDGK